MFTKPSEQIRADSKLVKDCEKYGAHLPLNTYPKGLRAHIGDAVVSRV